MAADQESPLFCARCLTTLNPGSGDFFVVSIEAIADPTPPSFTEEDLQRDARQEIDALVEQMSGCSERELMDQVRRSTVLHLCNRCYRDWIEDPAG
jgi:hypothetical protein